MAVSEDLGNISTTSPRALKFLDLDILSAHIVPLQDHEGLHHDRFPHQSPISTSDHRNFQENLGHRY